MFHWPQESWGAAVAWSTAPLKVHAEGSVADPGGGREGGGSFRRWGPVGRKLGCWARPKTLDPLPGL